MCTFIIILILLSFGISIFALWALSKLNKYISRLENQIENQLDRIDDLEDLLLQSNIKNKKIIRKNIIPEDED